MDELRRKMIIATVTWWMNMIHAVCRFYFSIVGIVLRRHQIRNKPYTVNFHSHKAHFRRLVYNSDSACHHITRMNMSTLDRLCEMLNTIRGLRPTKNMLVDEQVAIFAHILGHHVKNRVIQVNFRRSGESVSRHFNKVLTAMMRLGVELFKTPDPVPANSSDARWKSFKNCLGALDGTHIRINVSLEDKARYRNQKGDITTNVLGVCSQDGYFIYVLPGWEGSAADGRVLRDSVSRRDGFRVSAGCYYLVDAGYTNCDGFLAPYRGQRYHLSEWTRGHQPTNPREFFNMKHEAARNVIERCFGLLKGHWAIPKSLSFYPVRTYNRIIIACCLLHNLLMRKNNVDLFADYVEGIETSISSTNINHSTVIEPTDAWSQWRDNLANEMYSEFRRRR